MIDNIKAADVVRFDLLLWSSTPEENDELCDIIQRLITGLSPEAADAALVDLFREINILREVRMEGRMRL
jgi:hypothetical protein